MVDCLLWTDFFENFKSNPHFWTIFSTVIFHKRVVGPHLGDFLINSSGHPGRLSIPVQLNGRRGKVANDQGDQIGRIFAH
jgi:hypothetical protein